MFGLITFLFIPFLMGGIATNFQDFSVTSNLYQENSYESDLSDYDDYSSDYYDYLEEDDYSDSENEEENRKAFDKLADDIKVQLMQNFYFSSYDTITRDYGTINYKFIDKNTVIIKLIRIVNEEELISYESYKIVGNYVVADLGGDELLGEIISYSSSKEPDTKAELYERYTDGSDLYDANTVNVKEDDGLTEFYDQMVTYSNSNTD